MSWIKVEDRLPKLETDVLTCSKDKHIEVNQLWTWGEDIYRWYDNNKFTDFEEITHWMPLPELPKE